MSGQDGENKKPVLWGNGLTTVIKSGTGKKENNRENGHPLFFKNLQHPRDGAEFLKMDASRRSS